MTRLKITCTSISRHLLVILCACLFCSCKERLAYWQVDYPPELEYQVNLFKEFAPPNTKAKKLKIVLRGHGLRTSDGILCAGLSKPKDHAIYLDTTSTHWKYAKTAFVLHELGHYVLGRKHNNNALIDYSLHESEIPESVMHISCMIEEEHMVDDVALKHYYLNELFNGY